MPLDQVNWGIIGCGNVTEVKSGPAFNRVEGSRLLAVMRRSPGKAQDYARRHGVPKWYEDAGQLIEDPEINAVYIATPPGSHAQYAIKAAEAGKHIYVEKPMALNHKECLDMIEAAEKAGVSLFVAYYRRRLPSFLKVKEWLDSGIIGTPRMVTIRLFKPLFRPRFPGVEPPWRFKPEIAGGGLFVDLASHQLDFLDYLFGPITEVKAFALNQTGVYPAEDVVGVSFTFESGIVGTGAWCFTASEESRTDVFEIIGGKGHIKFSTFDFTPIELYSPDHHPVLDFAKPKHVQEHLIRTVVDELSGKGECPSTGISAARTTKIMDNILNEYYNNI
jgi:predicted dehydrogenase